MKNYFPLICLAGLLAFTAFIETPGSDQNKQGGTLQVTYDPESEPLQAEEMTMRLENRLVGAEEQDGYIVEKYQEIEVYSDENGSIIKTVPTSHFEYLKYKK
ncbi:hypothetical protein [Peribacillus sp. SCS-37]|uniref:hypothetical protein n=1 Tax=Paraperibacillus esterisolvens TaxID=3115296 RepID=UPI003906CD90